MPVTNTNYPVPQLHITKETSISAKDGSRVKYLQEIPARGIKLVIPESYVHAAIDGLEYFAEKSETSFKTVQSWAEKLDLPKALDALESVFGKNRVPTPIYNAVIFANSKRYCDEIVIPGINQDIILALESAEHDSEIAKIAFKNADKMVKHGKRFGLDLTSRL